MLGTKRDIGVVGAIALLVAFGASSLSAQSMESAQTMQQDRFSVDIRGGGALPASDDGGFREVVEPGASFGIGASYAVHPRFNLRVDGDVELLPGDELIEPAGGNFPDQQLWHYNAGIEAQILPDSDWPWKLHANIGVGATTLSIDEFTVNGQSHDISDTNFTLNGSVRVGYALAGSTDVFAAFHSYRTFVDETDTEALVALNEAPFAAGRPGEGPLHDPYGSAWTFPVQLGLRYHF